MNRRSKGGCYDCKKAKVKCDEIKPFCGTCRRRRHICRGYAPTSTTRSAHSQSQSQESHQPDSSAHQNGYNTMLSHSQTGAVAVDNHHASLTHPKHSHPFERFNDMTLTTAFSAQTLPKAGHPLIMDPVLITPRALGLVPGLSLTSLTEAASGILSPTNCQTDCQTTTAAITQPLEVYFTRHPWELSMDAEFVAEMNANVLAVLQHNPQALIDSLSAIGHSYIAASVPAPRLQLAVLDYRARIFSTLRAAAKEVEAQQGMEGGGGGGGEKEKWRLEEIVFMLLGLCAIELVDCSDSNTYSTTTMMTMTKAQTAEGPSSPAPVDGVSPSTSCDSQSSQPPETTIPAIIANAAALLTHWVSLNRHVSSLARYFIRALARQDMIISLVRLRRPAIPTEIWLDEQARTTPDRLMGCTMTLMPLLEELCALAEDMRGLLRIPSSGPASDIGVDGHIDTRQRSDDTVGEEVTPKTPAQYTTDFPIGNYVANKGMNVPKAYEYGQWVDQDYYDNNLKETLTDSFSYDNPQQQMVTFPDFAQRGDDLRRRIELWKPPHLPHNFSFRRSRRFLTQVTCYRAGALLYLYRLFHPAQPYNNTNSDIETPRIADQEATEKAYDVLMSTVVAATNPDEVKMLLWPVFLAACEMASHQDRQSVLDVFDAIMSQRRTATVQRSRDFVVKRVWPARDAGRVWNWMVLAQEFPNECLPI